MKSAEIEEELTEELPQPEDRVRARQTAIGLILIGNTSTVSAVLEGRRQPHATVTGIGTPVGNGIAHELALLQQVCEAFETKCARRIEVESFWTHEDLRDIGIGASHHLQLNVEKVEAHRAVEVIIRDPVELLAEVLPGQTRPRRDTPALIVAHETAPPREGIPRLDGIHHLEHETVYEKSVLKTNV